MKKKTVKDCAHESFDCEKVSVEGFRYKLAVVRCKDCGEAVGVFIADLPTAINSIGRKIDGIKSSR